jgi:hypothetical protein
VSGKSRVPAPPPMMMASVSDLKEEEGWTVIAVIFSSIFKQKHQQLFKNQADEFH